MNPMMVYGNLEYSTMYIHIHYVPSLSIAVFTQVFFFVALCVDYENQYAYMGIAYSKRMQMENLSYGIRVRGKEKGRGKMHCYCSQTKYNMLS